MRATRLTYVGELGWELYVPVEFAVGVYEQLIAAGRDLGLVNAGYYAIDSLRLEKGYRAWGRELTPDINPFEAGLSFAVKLDKPAVSRTGGAARRVRGRRGRGAAPGRLAGGRCAANEPLGQRADPARRQADRLRSPRPPSGTRSAGRSALGVVTRADGAADGLGSRAGDYNIDLAGERHAATVSLKAPYDPRIATNKKLGEQMLVGVPKEIKVHEYRVGLTPSSVREMTMHRPPGAGADRRRCRHRRDRR